MFEWVYQQEILGGLAGILVFLIYGDFSQRKSEFSPHTLGFT